MCNLESGTDTALEKQRHLGAGTRLYDFSSVLRLPYGSHIAKALDNYLVTEFLDTKKHCYYFCGCLVGSYAPRRWKVWKHRLVICAVKWTSNRTHCRKARANGPTSI